MNGRIRTWLDARPWIWSFAAALLVWLATALVAEGRGILATLAVALQFATFYAIVGIGQMLAISAGPGNIDLSIPGVMTFAGYVAMGLMNGSDAGLAAGLAAGVAVGLAAGAFNVGLIQGLRIPPMIGTLASGFVFQSMAIAYSRTTHAAPAPALVSFSAARLLGVPVIALIFIILTALVALALNRTVFGRSVLAIGQNIRAARLAGLAVRRTLASVYVLSGLLAAIAGILLSAYSGGAALDMGADYLLMSIAVVVLGGTSIAGGQASPAGLWGAATLLDLVVTMLNVMRVGAGVRYVVTGLIIIGVLALAKGRDQAA
ncbi:MAG TPA: ABC transporter permease [Acetobacteraceae bacterium]|jgi:ribose transport system permease protein|nr:ABC transporter permease [Acetobacteraceae bacterium]